MKIYNTLTKEKEEFIPIEKNKIKMYICGQTVYDFCHLGHARKEIVFDTIRKWFIESDYEVTFVENITDIEDKIIARANKNDISIFELTEKYIKLMHEDFEKLGLLLPDFEPKATQYINEMINIIVNLIKKGYAYQDKDGDVYYNVAKFKNYGNLSGKKIEELFAGERVEVDTRKKNPMDFVLWKLAKVNEPSWDSPFGKGRPGWHIECSAMSESILGKTFDIHGGGQDLQFPHHENEIAQSEAHNDCKFANYWMHNGFLNIEDEKMSKSTGNFYTLREVLEKYDSEVVRFFMIKTHYRSPLNFKFSLLDEVKNELVKFYKIKELIENNTYLDIEVIKNNLYFKKFKLAMDDDFNTPLALSVLYEIIHEINIKKDLTLARILINLSNILGIVKKPVKDFLYMSSKNVIDVVTIENLINERKIAKESKNYKLADEIREKLNKIGVVIEDNKNGTQWRMI